MLRIRQSTAACAASVSQSTAAPLVQLQSAKAQLRRLKEKSASVSQSTAAPLKRKVSFSQPMQRCIT